MDLDVLDRIAHLPRSKLAVLPTPLLRLRRLSGQLGVELWIKRDDLTGLGMGGNKARKLEFLAGQATEEGANVLVTGGGPGSNHTQLTAAAAARLGFACVLVFYGSAPKQASTNMSLASSMGAELVFTNDPDRASVDRKMTNVCDALASEGRRPFCIPRGGASPLGCVGYVEAAFEIQQELAELGIEQSHIFLATGSCGTHAGLLLGLTLAGSQHRVIGVTVSRPMAECTTRISSLFAACALELGITYPLPKSDILLLDYIGPGYGQASPEGNSAASLAARTEGLLLDPVYTAKAFAAMLNEISSGSLDGPVVFLHTGGLGGLIPTAAGFMDSPSE